MEAFHIGNYYRKRVESVSGLVKDQKTLNRLAKIVCSAGYRAMGDYGVKLSFNETLKHLTTGDFSQQCVRVINLLNQIKFRNGFREMACGLSHL